MSGYLICCFLKEMFLLRKADLVNVTRLHRARLPSACSTAFQSPAPVCCEKAGDEYLMTTTPITNKTRQPVIVHRRTQPSKEYPFRVPLIFIIIPPFIHLCFEASSNCLCQVIYLTS